jgi:diamine N-acetyltransferase
MNKLNIRKGIKDDAKTILMFIKELAEFEKEPESVKMTEEILIKDGFETNNPLFYTLIIEYDSKPIGFSLYFYIYSTWEGKSLYLEDLYIQENFRKKGFGTIAFKYLAKIAQDGIIY